jgi:hypothetical protein
MEDLVGWPALVVGTTAGMAEPVFESSIDPDRAVTIGHDSVEQGHPWVAASAPFLKVVKPC